MWVFFAIWGGGTVVSLLFLDGAPQFVGFIVSALIGVWVTAARESDGTEWAQEVAKRSGDGGG
jgi:hypothetical protein